MSTKVDQDLAPGAKNKSSAVTKRKDCSAHGARRNVHSGFERDTRTSEMLEIYEMMRVLTGIRSMKAYKNSSTPSIHSSPSTPKQSPQPPDVRPSFHTHSLTHQGLIPAQPCSPTATQSFDVGRARPAAAPLLPNPHDTSASHRHPSKPIWVVRNNLPKQRALPDDPTLARRISIHIVIAIPDPEVPLLCLTPTLERARMALSRERDPYSQSQFRHFHPLPSPPRTSLARQVPLCFRSSQPAYTHGIPISTSNLASQRHTAAFSRERDQYSQANSGISNPTITSSHLHNTLECDRPGGAIAVVFSTSTTSCGASAAP
ncbi:hypothetical protein DFP72DRAFT_1152797 [Ephemerocybe angulata]|uniref:Uncharacterized protein n=1 Tax=Ephemerocybe angulata TaxID=980116 RepID=A0A8H6LW79_9AGAR|nr:hypothetical protein DFP72DRAFT_1050867 [Tulosesus angulatus]KAF6746178.1 hypothetical protein DFP72DRAFT_1152797 [Tulosesus angulatus]